MVHIIQQYYKNERRQAELDRCLLNNAANPSVTNVHLLVEMIYDLSFIPEEHVGKIIQVNIGRRLEYVDAFDYYNSNLSNKVCILMNADIYTDESIDILNHVNFKNTVFTLNRYEDNADDAPALLNGLETDDYTRTKYTGIKPYEASIWSQDAWAWCCEHIQVPGSNFQLGTVGCDNYINYLFMQAGFTVMNPSRHVCVLHLDRLSNEECEYGIRKGVASKNRENRVGTFKEYAWFENMDDIPDKYTLTVENKNKFDHAKLFQTKKAVMSKNTEIVRGNYTASSFSDGCEPEKADFEATDHYWAPKGDDAEPWLQINFAEPTKVAYIDIQGKPIDRNNKAFGYAKTLTINGIEYKGNRVKNANHIQRIYFHNVEAVTGLRIENFVFEGLRAFKIRTYCRRTTNMIDHTVDENGNHLYYYTGDDWQKPVITEYTMFDYFVNKKNPIPHHYFAFPWANHIDNKWKRKTDLNEIIDACEEPTVPCFTVAQHMRWRNLIDIFVRLNIKYIFTPHKIPSDVELEKKYGFTIVAISLFPPQVLEGGIRPKTLLTSFVGQYDPKCYLTTIRPRIFEMFANKPDCYVQQRSEWHYQSTVFKEKESETAIKFATEYKDLLAKSKFSLCPSGSGPNSIRIWESMSFGSIPVILADTLILAEIKDLDYSDAFVFWKEDEVDKLYDHLKNFDEAKAKQMERKNVELFHQYFSKEKMPYQILKYFNVPISIDVKAQVDDIFKNRSVAGQTGQLGGSARHLNTASYQINDLIYPADLISATSSILEQIAMQLGPINPALILQQMTQNSPTTAILQRNNMNLNNLRKLHSYITQLLEMYGQ